MLPFPAPFRVLRGLREPLARPAATGHVDAFAGPPSMFDSAGASGLTVEVPESEEGALALHAHLNSSPEVAAMLILDPAGAWAPGVMQALAEATGSPVDRLRVHARRGTEIRAVVDETLLPAGTGPHRLVRCLHGHDRPSDRRAVFAALLAHTQVCAVLVGPMPPAEAQSLVEEVGRLAREPGHEPLHWVFYLAPEHRGLEWHIDMQRWPTPPTVVHARPMGRSPASVWNSLYTAWLGG
jgi:hypothetical protein